jgi:hypothetical protein
MCALLSAPELVFFETLNIMGYSLPSPENSEL